MIVDAYIKHEDHDVMYSLMLTFKEQFIAKSNMHIFPLSVDIYPSRFFGLYHHAEGNGDPGLAGLGFFFLIKCMFVSNHQFRKKIIPALNCSQQGLQIILSSQILISGKRPCS